MDTSSSCARILPAPDQLTLAFWTGGEHGLLLIQRCGSCQRFQHPPSALCPQCGASQLVPVATSGLGTVASCTVNHQAWRPGLTVPYSVAIVELDEQPGLRLTTNIVGCDPQAVHIGQRVRVQFEQQEDVWIPLFTPEGGASRS